MVKLEKPTIPTLRNGLTLFRNAALADLRAEISTLWQELNQEMEAVHSQTSFSLRGRHHNVEEEINKLHQGYTAATTKQADMAVQLNDAIERI